MAGSVSYSSDPTLYLYTSLTAGSSHIITATSRLETILKANRIPFRALDCATDEKARMLWGRRSKGRKLPGLVKYGMIIGDLEQIEEWNEYGELKEQIAATSDFGAGLSATSNLPGDQPTSSASTLPKSDPPSRASSETRHILISEPKHASPSAPDPSPANAKSTDSPLTMAMRQAGAEAAAKAGQKKALAATGKAAPAVSKTSPNTDKTSTPASIEEPATAPEITATKTPAQLATEGAKRTSVDKITDITAEAEETSPHSTEEQVLEAQRSSSVTKQKSQLSESTPADQSETVGTEEEQTKVDEPDEAGEKVVSTTPATDNAQEAAPTGRELQSTGPDDTDAANVSVGD